jgi:glutamate synthase (NADPH/NADH) large chain
MEDELYHADFLIPEPYDILDAEARESIHGLVQLHAEKTFSNRAYHLLSAWDELAPRFIRLTPKPQA